MNPKKLASKTGQDAPMNADKMEDACFEKSSAPMINLQFKQGDYLSVHRAVLQRNPKLTLLDTSSSHQWGGKGSQPPSLKHISRGAGHVLVHYLYSDSYHTLKWVGPTTGCKETIARLKTGFEVYATARKYQLDGLEELAKEQISLLSKGVDAFTVIDVVNEVYPSSTDKDTWFPTYMKTIIKTAFEDSAALLKPEAHLPSENEFENDVPTATTLLRGALEVYHEMVEALAVKGTSVTPEQLTPVTDHSQLEDDELEIYATTKKKNERDTKSISAAVGEPKVVEPVKPAEPGVYPIGGGLGATGIKEKKKEECIVAKEPEQMPEPEKEGGTATGNTTAVSVFGNGSTTGTEFRTFSFGSPRFGASTQTSTGFGATMGTGMFGTLQSVATGGLGASTNKDTGGFGTGGGGLFGRTTT